MSIQRLTFLEDNHYARINYEGQPGVALFKGDIEDNFVIAIEVNLLRTDIEMFPIYRELNYAGYRIHNIGWDCNVFRKT